ncbi:probable xyloglucan galactosyltransferase GT14 [Argentina anserina]|uniref:probable xyloglucan galactosyltransferase GT14 n=1 Tax=Argentina anserina TaxID=57926 RepID=UPI0021762D0C|nr:probable xyloglucan galactosyltransferase GT14 [Potentilla anserina]
MEKTQWIAGGNKCRNHLWFVLTASFLIFLVLTCTDYSSLNSGRNFNRVTYFITNLQIVTQDQDQNHHPPNSLPPAASTDFLASDQTRTTNNSSITITSKSTPAPYSVGQGRQPNNVISSNKTKMATSVIYTPPPQAIPNTKHQISDSDSCSGRYIYVYDLPKRFNQDLLKNCHSLHKWTDMCPYMSNMGLGPKLTDKSSKRRDRLLGGKGWFATNQFSLEVIFHNRMKKYKCLTNDSSLASAIFVPFYAGLDVGQYLWDYNTSIRDASPLELMKWLSNRPEWKTMWGKDHFLVGGRIAWDFRRQTEDDSAWGSKLMFLPESKNMTLLSIESSLWSNEQAIPYPTYFHPSKESQVSEWQRRMRKLKRPYLFTFAGAPRPEYKENIRDMVISQCQSSTKHCKLVGCYHGANKCDDPLNVMKVFQSSVFCLQPSGDSFTRRSIFDSILAGCIPVFFHPGSAYVQYTWHFLSSPSKYSVFIFENDIKEKKVMINETLLRIPKAKVEAMREEVIRMIPRIIYADPRAPGLETLEDAFDIAVKGLLDKVKKTRWDMEAGRDPGNAFSQLKGTKFDMPGTKRRE